MWFTFERMHASWQFSRQTRKQIELGVASIRSMYCARRDTGEIFQHFFHSFLGWNKSWSNHCVTVVQKYMLNEEFELTANSLGAHIETHKKQILRTLSYLTVNSQDD